MAGFACECYPLAMIIPSLFLVVAPVLAADLPPLPGMGGPSQTAAPAEPKPLTAESTPVATPAPAAAVPATPAPAAAPAPAVAAPVAAPKREEAKKPQLMPPAIPARPAGTLDSAGAVAMDLAVRVQYFEDGQSYYRAYTKGGSHSAEENRAFLKFLEDYDKELEIARKVHTLLGVWLEKKSAVKD